MADMKIPAVEDRILEGFQTRYQQTFGSDLVIAQTPDQIKQLQLRKNGVQPSYPFAYAKLSTVASPESTDYYVSRYLLRQGVPFVLGDSQNTVYNLRLLPTQFDLQITYETNRATGDASVMWYIKRWLMASRMGLLKFRVDIGNIRLNIGITMDLNVTVPERESPSEAKTGYKVEANASIHGYMSEIQAKPGGLIKTINIVAETSDGSEIFNNKDSSNGN